MKTKTFFVCQNCGAQSPRWGGKCPSCESWNTMAEETIVPLTDKRSRLLSEAGPVLLSDVLTQ